MRKKITLVALLAFICLSAHATFTPIALTGFNEDVIANGSGASASSVSANLTGTYTGIDNDGYVLNSEDYVAPNGNTPTYFLPTGGLVSSAITAGLTFQLADYSSNNALFLVNSGDTGLLSFVTPQSAGALFVTGLSTAGSSNFDVVVHFSDGTSQTFAGNYFNDWYQTPPAASVPGIGRISAVSGAIDQFTTSQNPHLFEVQLSLDAANFTKTITGITATKTTSGAYLLIMGVTANSVCTGTPTAGTVVTDQSTGCSEYIANLSLVGGSIDGGLAYQWQTSTDGVNFTNLAGATNSTYSADVTGNIYYRDSVTCQGSGNFSISSSIELLYTAPAPVYATLPYFQGFENWFGTCYTFDRPDSSITLNPTTGNNSWRRDDQGTDANWGFIAGGAYTPVSTQLAHSARLHTYENFNGPGDMDLHVNLSDPNSKLITFDYRNNDQEVQFSGSGLTVSIDTDGTGTNWIQLAQYHATPGWVQEAVITSIVSAHAVIRFEGAGIFTSEDMGLDSLSIVTLTPCTGQPTAGALTTTQLSGCSEYTPTISLPLNTTTGGFTYQWYTSSNGVTYTAISGATNTTYQADITANTYFYATVTCTASTLSSSSDTIEELYVVPVGSYATLPYFQGFENWMGSCYNFDRPDSSWILTPTSGSNSWRRDDQGADAAWNFIQGGVYTPASTELAHSARLHTYENFSGPGDMDLYVNFSDTNSKLITFDYRNNDQEVQFSGSGLTVSIDTDGTGANWIQLAQYAATPGWVQEAILTNIVSAHAVIRFEGAGTFTSEDMGIDSLSIVTLAPCTGQPTAGALTTTQLSGCSEYTPTISLPLNTTTSGFTYQWYTSSNGVTYTAITGATNTTYQADITANTYFYATVTCAASTLSSSSDTIEELYVVPVAAYATLPYFQGFENWMGTCYNYDRPDSSWILTPVHGDNSWRRDDQGADASWHYVNDGTYSPAFTEGAHSARFHSSEGYYDNNESGTMDLYVNMTAGTKLITFDYININTDVTFDPSSLTVEISTDNGTTFTTLGQYNNPVSNWTQEVLTTTAVGNAIIRFQGNTHYSYGDQGIDSLNIYVLPPCSGMPTASLFSISQSSGCIPYTPTLSVDTPEYATGIVYQWQSSTDSITFTSIPGATTYVYTPTISATAYYRYYVLCTNSSDSVFSAAQHLTYTPEPIVIATVPYFQGFENWISSNCYTTDRPDSSWSQTVPYGLQAWRRDDQGVSSGGWNYNFGSYSPASTELNHSARFHVYEAPAGTEGDMDLHINLSTPGTKQIQFDFTDQNQYTTDNMVLELSEDTGQTWTTLGTYNANGPNNTTGWTSEYVNTTSVAPNAIIRFAGMSQFGTYDIGIDSVNVYVLPPCSGMPTPGTFSSSQTTGCTPYISNLAVNNVIQATGISYYWQSSTDNVTFTPVSGATGTTYSAFVGSTTYYRFAVVCSNGPDTAYSASTELALIPEVASTATLPYFQGFESWTGTCTLYDRPDTNWLNMQTTGNQSWRREDQGTDANWTNPFGGQYTPASSQLNHSASFDSYDSPSGSEGDLDLHVNLSNPGTKTILFDYFNNYGNDSLSVELSEDGGTTFTLLSTYYSGDYTGLTGWNPNSLTTTSVAANAIIRFAGFGDQQFFSGSDNIGIDSLSIAGPACDTITGLAINGINQTGATASWTAVGGTAGYEVVVDQSSGAPTGSILNTGNTSDVITGLLSGTTYYVHVRDSCGPGAVSSWTTIAFNTTTCDTVTNLAVSGITMTGATANWTAVSGTAGYEVTVNQSPTSPTVVGANTGTNSYNAVSLLPGTTYYVHVRDSCGPGSYSAWTTVTFTTLACDSITGLTVTGVSDHGATVSWNAVAGTSGYEYVIGTSSSTPATWLTTTNTSVTESTLNPSTVYYVFVRDSCGPNTFSVWDTLSFTTYNLGIGSVNGSQFNVDAYPNPASDIITVRVYGVKGDNRKVSLTDVAGRTISTVDMASDRVDFNMANLASGIYLIRYEDDAHTRVIKVNKQ